MTTAERQLCDFITDHEAKARPGEGRLGHFFSHLFEAIARADAENLVRLRTGFPDQVRAWNGYKNENYYWMRLQREYRGVEA